MTSRKSLCSSASSAAIVRSASVQCWTEWAGFSCDWSHEATGASAIAATIQRRGHVCPLTLRRFPKSQERNRACPAVAIQERQTQGKDAEHLSYSLAGGEAEGRPFRIHVRRKKGRMDFTRLLFRDGLRTKIAVRPDTRPGYILAGIASAMFLRSAPLVPNVAVGSGLLLGS